MKLKRSSPTSHEEGFFLEKKQNGWRFFQKNDPQHFLCSLNNAVKCGYSETLNLLGNMNNLAMSFCENFSKIATQRVDGLPDLEYTETSPLLIERNLKSEDPNDDFNNNEHHKTRNQENVKNEDFLYEMIGYENRSRYNLERIYDYKTEKNSRDNLYIDSETYDSVQLKECKLSPEQNIPCNEETSNSLDVSLCYQTRNNMPDVLPINVSKSNTNFISPNSNTNFISPMSDTSCSSDLDINMASYQFNNFSIPISKRNDIQYLVQHDIQAEKINIKENSIEEISSSLNESKILNISEPLHKNMIKKCQNQLANFNEWNQTTVQTNETKENTIMMKNKTDFHERNECTSSTQFEKQSEENSPTNTILYLEKYSDNPQHIITSDLRKDKIDKNVTTPVKPHFHNSNHNWNSSMSSSLTPEDNNAIELMNTIYIEKSPFEQFDYFDVYNIETSMPSIDWAMMEDHLANAAKEENWYKRKTNDREEIRRKLAMESDSDDYYLDEKVIRKPNLATRLKNGMNLQICFMNETAMYEENQGNNQYIQVVTNKEDSSHKNQQTSQMTAEQDSSLTPSFLPSNNALCNNNNEISSEEVQLINTQHQRPSFFSNRQKIWRSGSLDSHTHRMKVESEKFEEDFFTRHARLKAEARVALAQAKEMAKMQMEVERQRRKKSPIADIIGLPLSDFSDRFSYSALNDLNVAQLQVIVNDLHTQIENLNEELVGLLLKRDDLHMEQDSMLIDVEDLTRFLGAKDEAVRNQQNKQFKKPKNAKT